MDNMQTVLALNTRSDWRGGGQHTLAPNATDIQSTVSMVTGWPFLANRHSFCVRKRGVLHQARRCAREAKRYRFGTSFSYQRGQRNDILTGSFEYLIPGLVDLGTVR
jgi:hypothetical protein